MAVPHLRCIADAFNNILSEFRRHKCSIGGCPIAFAGELIGGACFFQILSHFGLPVYLKLRWLGAFNPHNEVSQHQYDFLSI
jgi:hypothetical protein